MKNLVILLVGGLLLVSGSFAEIAYQTGFDQTDDISGANYTLGDAYGQNGWTQLNLYGSAFIENGGIAHDNDGMLTVRTAIGSGISHASGISSSSSVSSITVEFARLGIGNPSYTSSSGKFAIKSSGLGDLFCWGYYATSNSYSWVSRADALWNVADADVWAGCSAGFGSPVNNSCFPYYLTTDESNREIDLTIEIHNTDTETVISYTSVAYYDDGTYSRTVTTSEFGMGSLYDLSEFGDLQILGSTNGRTLDVYMDGLTISYVPEPMTMLLLASGGVMVLCRRR